MKNNKCMPWIVIILLVTIVLLACNISIVPTGQSTPVAIAATPTPALASPTPIVKTPSPQPPTATLIPTAEVITLGKILFEDSLASNQRGWTEGTFEESFFFQDGAYHIKSGGYERSYSYPWTSDSSRRIRAGDFVVEVDATRVEGPDTMGYGVYFRRTDDAYYFFELSGRGSFRVRKGEIPWQVIVDWTPHPAIKPGRGPNALRVVGKGDTFTLFVNDVKVGTFRDSTFSEGEVGPIVYTGGGTAHAAFDNFRLWNLGSLVTPSGTPAAGVPTPEEFVKGTLLFEDDFATNKSEWREETGQYKNIFQDGKYHVSVYTSGGWMSTGDSPQVPRLNDFVLEVEGALMEGSNSDDYGVFFREAEGEHYYFSINADGTFAFYKSVMGIWTTLIPETSSPAIKKSPNPNVIRIVAKGTSFIFFINGTRVGAHYGDDSLSEGTVMLVVGSDKNELARAAYSNLMIWELVK